MIRNVTHAKRVIQRRHELGKPGISAAVKRFCKRTGRDSREFAGKLLPH